MSVLNNAMEPSSLVIVDPTELRSTEKMSGTKENMMFRPGAPGANCISQSMNIIRFWCANRPQCTGNGLISMKFADKWAEKLVQLIREEIAKGNVQT